MPLIIAISVAPGCSKLGRRDWATCAIATTLFGIVETWFIRSVLFEGKLFVGCVINALYYSYCLANEEWDKGEVFLEADIGCVLHNSNQITLVEDSSV